MTDQLDIQVHLATQQIRRQFDEAHQRVAAWEPREEVNHEPRRPQHR